jgi:surfeit locus 1 family protein
MARLNQVVVWAATAVGMAVTASLGVWQLQRADTKQALHEAMLARGAQAPWSADRLPCEASAWQAAEQHRVLLQGRWLHQHTLYLDNRPMQGRAGFVVLTPLQLAHSPGCTASVVLVQRGWVPRDPRDRLRLPDVPQPEGDVTLLARITWAPSRLMSLGGSGAETEQGLIRQNVDPEALAREWGLRLRPGSLQQLDEGVNSADGLLRHWWQPSADVGKHQAYAAQWFGMAAALLGLCVWSQWIRPKGRALSAAKT